MPESFEPRERERIVRKSRHESIRSSSRLNYPRHLSCATGDSGLVLHSRTPFHRHQLRDNFYRVPRHIVPRLSHLLTSFLSLLPVADYPTVTLTKDRQGGRVSSQVRTHAPPELEVRGSFGREERCTCEGSVCVRGRFG